jgi:peptidoglycan/LPS O-acetylase OafA/YrhL
MKTGRPKRAASRPMRSQRGYDLEQLKLMTSRNQSLDVLRGIAVLLVIVSHYSITLPRSSAFYETGAVGVDLFFVLSGFLISGLLFSEFRKSGTIRLKRFWIRRGFKIYPPFYALVALTAIAALVGSHQFPSQLLWEFVFLQNYGHPFWPHTWSLAVEEHFYFLLPMLLLLLIRVGKGKPNPFRAIPFISMGLSLICLYLRILALWRGNDWGHIAFPTHLRIDALFAGVTLGYYAHFTPESFREAGKSWVLAFGLFFAATFVIMPDVPRLTFAYVAFSFIVAWAVNRSPSKNPLAKGLSWIGYYSYSIYLWHVVAMLGLEHLPARWFRFPLYFVAAISLGVLMAKVIEVPALRLRDKVFPSSSLVTSTRPRSEGMPIPATAVVGKGLARI